MYNTTFFQGGSVSFITLKSQETILNSPNLSLVNPELVNKTPFFSCYGYRVVSIATGIL